MRHEGFSEKSRNVFISEDRTMIYHIGIIDYLQEWNMTKKLERSYKVHIQRRSRTEISAVEPTFYRTRFMENMKTILNFNQEKNKKKALWDEFYRLEDFYDYGSRANSVNDPSINDDQEENDVDIDPMQLQSALSQR